MLVRLPADDVSSPSTSSSGASGRSRSRPEGRLDNPTAVVPPGDPAIALQTANNLRKIILDDWNNRARTRTRSSSVVAGSRCPPPTRYAAATPSTNIVGVLTWTCGGDANASPNAYRIRPVNALGWRSFDFQPTNPRPGASIDVAGNVRVAGLNLLELLQHVRRVQRSGRQRQLRVRRRWRTR